VAAVDAIEEFVTGRLPQAAVDSVLATILFTDIVVATRSRVFPVNGPSSSCNRKSMRPRSVGADEPYLPTNSAGPLRSSSGCCQVPAQTTTASNGKFAEPPLFSKTAQLELDGKDE
jgi:hypothetical protein